MWKLYYSIIVPTQRQYPYVAMSYYLRTNISSRSFDFRCMPSRTQKYGIISAPKNTTGYQYLSEPR